MTVACKKPTETYQKAEQRLRADGTKKVRSLFRWKGNFGEIDEMKNKMKTGIATDFREKTASQTKEKLRKGCQSRYKETEIHGEVR